MAVGISRYPDIPISLAMTPAWPGPCGPGRSSSSGDISGHGEYQAHSGRVARRCTGCDFWRRCSRATVFDHVSNFVDSMSIWTFGGYRANQGRTSKQSSIKRECFTITKVSCARSQHDHSNHGLHPILCIESLFDSFTNLKIRFF